MPGRVRMAGRVAPFIELGVGFNPEMTARENTLLNGVLFGLSRRQAAKMLDAVMDFGELQDFVELKIKNYSSGMMVRLAFAIMVQADADIMLIDEVLAVGDAAFGQKCMDVFYERRAAGKTIVLVTHDMSTVQSLCHRAMVIHDGEVQYEGEPERRRARYYRLNFGGAPTEPGRARQPARRAGRRRSTSTRGCSTPGSAAAATASRWPTSSRASRSSSTPRSRPPASWSIRVLVFHVATSTGSSCSRSSARSPSRRPGQRVRLDGRIENRLVPGATRSTAGSARTDRSATWRCSRCACPSSSSTARRPATGSLRCRPTSSRCRAQSEPLP